MAQNQNSSNSTLGQWIGGLGPATTSTVTISGGLAQSYGTQQAQFGYPVSTPQPMPYIPHVPVIDENHPEPLHFRTSDGLVHSFTIADVFTKLGLKW